MSERLKELRKKDGKTQEEFAGRLGIARSTYSGYERGTSEPDNETLDKIANYFMVSTDYLLGRTEEPNRVLKEQARKLIDMIDLELTNEQIIETMDLYVDGIKVEEEEVRIFVDLVRGSRIRMKQGLSSTERKQ